MSGKAGKNREDYRKNNRGHVLKLVATGECKNRTELTKAMGLSKMSISRIVSEMMGAGILAEEGTAGSDEPGRARPENADPSKGKDLLQAGHGY